MIRHLQAEELVVVGSGFMGEILVDGVACAETGLPEQRLELSDELGEAQRVIAGDILEVTKLGCPNYKHPEDGDDKAGCALGLLEPINGDGYPGEAVYHCPRAEETCGRIVITAARRAEHRNNTALSKGIKAIRAFMQEEI